MSTQQNLGPNAVSATVALYPSAFIDEPNARPLFGDEAPVPRAGHPEDLDQDDIPTVKMLLVLPGDEPPPELLARAEPISPAPAATHEPAPAPEPEPDERITFTVVRAPIPGPDFQARLVEIHRRSGFRIPFHHIQARRA